MGVRLAVDERSRSFTIDSGKLIPVEVSWKGRCRLMVNGRSVQRMWLPFPLFKSTAAQKIKLRSRPKSSECVLRDDNERKGTNVLVEWSSGMMAERGWRRKKQETRIGDGGEAFTRMHYGPIQTRGSRGYERNQRCTLPQIRPRWGKKSLMCRPSQ